MDFLNAPLNDDVTLKVGQFLLAEPMLNDPNFDRSVILICKHDQDGTFGLVVNRPTTICVDEATDLYQIQEQLFVGGPVAQNTLHFLHQLPVLESAYAVTDSIFWGGDIEQLRELAAQQKVNKHTFRFFLGYSGWGAEQLADEIKSNTWIISNESPEILFSVEPHLLWQTILKNMGGKYKVYANFPTHPSYN